MKFNPITGGLLATTVVTGIAAVTTPAQALLIVPTYDSSVTSSPESANIQNDFSLVASEFDSSITNNITVDIDVGLGEADGIGIPSTDVSQSRDTFDTPTVSSEFGALQTAMEAVNNTQIVGNADPSATLLFIPTAEEKALGLGLSTSTYDGYIGFSSTDTFSFATNGTIATGQYSFVADAEHEISEVLGRTSELNAGGNLYESYETPLDLLRFTAPGTQSDAPNITNGNSSEVYLSTNGGTLDLGTVNETVSVGDLTDWQNPASAGPYDAQDSELYTGEPGSLSISDEDVLKGLGYTFSNSQTLFTASVSPVGASPSVNQSTPVPEPASLSVLAVGVAAMSGLWRRRRRA